MVKDDICWGIFSGEVLLPFTIRLTKYLCVEHRLKDTGLKSLRKGESCRKIVINEWKNTRRKEE